jgi:hypothetical protein
MLPGTESWADLFKSADGGRTSGISKHAKLHQYTGAVAGMAEQRKAAKLWNLESLWEVRQR